MDNLPEPILSPSKAAQAASLSFAWSEVTRFLTPAFKPHPLPLFERNPDTLLALKQLVSHSSTQTNQNSVIACTISIALRELQSSIPSVRKSHDNTVDYTIPILLFIASSLSSEAQSTLRTLSILSVDLGCLPYPSPESMAVSLTHLTRDESETAQQLARVESLHQQLKSQYALAQEMLDRLRGESSASSTSTLESGGCNPFQTPAGLVTKAADWGRGSKQANTKIDEYRERARRLETAAKNRGNNITLPELRVEERELRDLEARVRGLEGRVRGYEGLPPDKELALLEVERMRRELEGLVRKRDGIFEGLVERRE